MVPSPPPERSSEGGSFLSSHSHRRQSSIVDVIASWARGRSRRTSAASFSDPLRARLLISTAMVMA